MTSYQPYPGPTPPAPEPVPARRLTRSSRDRIIGGVCGGFAEYSGLDANLIRIILVAATVLGLGSGVIIYLAGWLLLPEY